MPKFSKAFEKIFGDSIRATHGKSADYFAEKRVRVGKTKKDRKANAE